MAEEEARRDLKEKLALEKKLTRRLRSFNRKLVSATIREHALGAGNYNAAAMAPVLAALLKTHYEKVGEVFAQQLTDIMPEEIAVTDTERGVIDRALISYFTARSVEQAAIITATNQRDIVTADDLANAIAQEQALAGKPQSRAEIAVQKGANLRRSLESRVKTITTFETQSIAEAAKLTEAQVLVGQAPSVTGGSPQVVLIIKEWVTVGDERVREAHMLADSQTRTINESFSVGGEALRWPGDTSQGASLGNVINCRCSSVIDKENVFAERRRRGELPFVDITASEQLLTSLGE